MCKTRVTQLYSREAHPVTIKAKLMQIEFFFFPIKTIFNNARLLTDEILLPFFLTYNIQDGFGCFFLLKVNFTT